MIETNKPGELFMHPDAEDGGNVQYWNYAEIRQHMPWFYVKYHRANDPEKISSMMLLLFRSQVHELHESEVIQISEVYLISPDGMNGTSDWKMHRIKEMWEGDYYIEGVNSDIGVYFTVDDQMMLSPRYEITLDDLDDCKKLYSIDE